MSEPVETRAGAAEAVADCPHCGKPMPLCICDGVTPIKNRIQLLILQHPQEQDRALGTARLTARHFKDAVVKIGLSWPSLSKALGRPVGDPSRWAVLYLGSAKAADLDTDAEIVAINRKGELEPNQRAILSDIEATLNESFERMLARYRQVQASMPELAPKPKKRDFPRRKRG